MSPKWVQRKLFHICPRCPPLKHMEKKKKKKLVDGLFCHLKKTWLSNLIRSSQKGSNRKFKATYICPRHGNDFCWIWKTSTNLRNISNTRRGFPPWTTSRGSPASWLPGPWHWNFWWPSGPQDGQGENNWKCWLQFGEIWSIWEIGDVCILHNQNVGKFDVDIDKSQDCTFQTKSWPTSLPMPLGPPGRTLRGQVADVWSRPSFQKRVQHGVQPAFAGDIYQLKPQRFGLLRPDWPKNIVKVQDGSRVVNYISRNYGYPTQA